MILACVGKGGSGKSTLSVGMARYLARTKGQVLAVDLDHNMDMAYDLEVPDDALYVGNALPEMLTYLGGDPRGNYRQMFLQPVGKRFHLYEHDPLTAQYAISCEKQLACMVAGPHTDHILYGKGCSHILTTPMKVYLPYLELRPHQYVVVDEKAGADGVGTGVTVGYDVVVIVIEPTRQSIKTATQLMEMLQFFQTPYVCVANKSSGEDGIRIAQEIGHALAAVFPFQQEEHDDQVWEQLLQECLERKSTVSRMDRAVAKYQKDAQHA